MGVSNLIDRALQLVNGLITTYEGIKGVFEGLEQMVAAVTGRTATY